MGRNRFRSKIRLSTTGVLKVSRSVGFTHTLSSATSLPPSLSIVPNFKSEEGGEMYELSPDWPEDEMKPGWGLLGNKECLSKKSAVGLSERMAAQEIEHGRDRLVFCTVTLPGGSDIQFEAMARWSSYLVNRLAQALRDTYGRGNYTRCGVWEYQERGALHYHLCLGFRDYPIKQNIDEFREWLSIAWMQCLHGLSYESGVEMFDGKWSSKEQRKRLLDYEDLGERFANAQVVEKSVVGYLSSYLTESNHGKDKNGLRRKFWDIATWAQWDREVTRIWRLHTIEVDTAVGAEFWGDWEKLRDLLFVVSGTAEDTEVMITENSWWKSVTSIPSQSRKEVMDSVMYFCRTVKAKMAVGFWDVVRMKSNRYSGNSFELIIADHERKVWGQKVEKEWQEYITSNVLVMGRGLLSHMVRMSVILQSQIRNGRAFDKPRQLCLLEAVHNGQSDV